MRVAVNQLAQYGLVNDQQAFTTPPNAWSDGRNITFNDGRVKRTLGRGNVFDPPSVTPYWLQYGIDTARAQVLLYAGTAALYAVLAGVHTNISRVGGYSGGESDRWNGGPFAGISIANNGIDVPQMWTFGSGSPAADLTAWPGTWRAKVLRPFKNFLIAMDVTVGANRFPHRIVFSHPADPGSVPPSWDIADPTKDVTSRDIVSEGGGGIVDGFALGDTFIIYKDDGAHFASFIGGQDKWRTAPLTGIPGALAQDCVTPFNKGKQHFVVSGEDIVVHTGSDAQSVIEERMRKWLHARISSTRFDRSFCFNDPVEGACWFCFPEEGADWPTLALVYPWRAGGAMTVRELGGAAFIAPGIVPAAGGTSWDAETAAWEAMTTTWDTFESKLFLKQPIGAFPLSSKLKQMSFGNQFDGANFTSYVEKTGLDIMGIDRYGHLLRDPMQKKIVRAVWPRASGGQMTVQLGKQTRVDGPVTWTTTRTFTPGTDEKVDFSDFVELYALRFSWVGSSYGELAGYDIDVEPLGQF